MRRMSRRQGVLFQIATFLVPYVVVPVLLSRRGRRRRKLNPVGLLPLGAGAALIVWSCVEHYRAAERGWAVSGKRLGQPPDYLLRTGPYAHMRNPVHLGGAAMLLGWSLLFGSRSVAAMLAVHAAGLAVLVPRWEERELEARFGDEYRRYRAEVPGWLPRMAPRHD